MKKQRRRGWKDPILPEELIREILLRLPVRSVLRLKCICKSWHSLISNPQFGISHYELAASPSHRILLRSNDFYVRSIDIDARKLNRKSAGVHFLLPHTSPFLLPPPSPPHRLDYCYHADDYQDQHDILGSCRGLVLLYYDSSGDLILWNPSIGVHKRIEEFQYPVTSQLLYGFGYDASTDDYLLILIAFESEYVENGIHIFSFKTELSSLNRNYNLSPYEILYDYKFGAGSLFNEALHWLVSSKDKGVPVIIAFDLIQRALSEIPLFDHFTAEKYEVYSLRAMAGCLSVGCSVPDSDMVEIWVMKEYKVQSSWTKSIVLDACSTCDFFSPICITKDGQIFVSNMCGTLEKINDKGERLDSLDYGGCELYEANLQCAMYRESLLSLPTSPPHSHVENMG